MAYLPILNWVSWGISLNERIDVEREIVMIRCLELNLKSHFSVLQVLYSFGKIWRVSKIFPLKIAFLVVVDDFNIVLS